MSEIQDQIVRAGGQVYAEALQEIERLKRLNTEERSELYGSHSTSQPRSFGQSEGKRGMLEFERRFPRLTQPPLCRAIDGVPDRSHRLKALGNAVVPQQAYPFFEAIAQTNQ